MSSASTLKTDWTWEEWQESRARRRAVAAKVGPPITRRRESTGDSRLRKTFNGERGPAFQSPLPHVPK